MKLPRKHVKKITLKSFLLNFSVKTEDKRYRTSTPLVDRNSLTFNDSKSTINENCPSENSKSQEIVFINKSLVLPL